MQFVGADANSSAELVGSSAWGNAKTESARREDKTKSARREDNLKTKSARRALILSSARIRATARGPLVCRRLLVLGRGRQHLTSERALIGTRSRLVKRLADL
eukprot:621897-Rhodomonas_salina.1